MKSPTSKILRFPLTLGKTTSKDFKTSLTTNYVLAKVVLCFEILETTLNCNFSIFRFFLSLKNNYLSICVTEAFMKNFLV